MKKVIAMALLLIFPRLLASQEIDIAALVGEDWYGLYMNGQKSGYSKNSVAIDKDGAVVVSEDAHFRVKMMNQDQNMRIYSKRIYSKQGDLIRIEQLVEDVGTKTFIATVEGDSLKLESTLGGTKQVETLPKPKDSLRDALKQIELVRNDAKKGDELQYSLFEPMYRREIEGISKIAGIEERNFEGAPTKVFEIETTIQNMGVKSTSFVTEKGKTLEDSIAGMLRMRLEPKEIAVNVSYNNDVIVSNAAVIDKPIPDARTRPSLHLRLEGPLVKEHLFTEERQQILERNGAFDFTGKKITLDGFQPAKRPIPATEDAARWLKPSLFVQSEDPRLVKKARELVGNTEDLFVISTSLCHWVYRNVKTSFSAQLSNALDVLEHPEGDCTEHSILFVGLARAAGLPAREVAGLIYVAGDKPAFYFHQWARVWVGKWIDVDPTFDQPLADATHIKLAEGDLFEQSKLVPVIGKLKVTVLDDSAK